METVEPKVVGIQYSNDEMQWHLIEGKGVVNGARALFECLDMALDVRGMLISRDNVEIDGESGKLRADWFKLTVHKHVLDAETTLFADSVHFLVAEKMVSLFWFSSISTVPNFKFREIVTKNGIFLTNMMSPARIIFL